jgi:hypothetical protein
MTFPRLLIKFPFLTSLNQLIYKSPEDFTKSQEINCTKVTLGEITYHDAPKLFVEYGQKLGKSLFYLNCENIMYEKKKIYASGDITLGGYLLLNIALNEKACRKC